jgi:hypothetical protein
MVISPRLIFLKIQAPTHTRPIRIKEPAINKLLLNISLSGLPSHLFTVNITANQAGFRQKVEGNRPKQCMRGGIQTRQRNTITFRVFPCAG